MSFEEMLISLVRENKILYNTKLKSYKFTSLKNKTWKSIAETLNCDVKDCRGRWKSLRDRFVREHRTQQALNSAIEFENAESTWKYYNMLSFLQGNIHSRKTLGSYLRDFGETSSASPFQNNGIKVRPTSATPFEAVYTTAFDDSTTPLNEPPQSKRKYVRKSTIEENVLPSLLKDVKEKIAKQQHTFTGETDDESLFFVKMLHQKLNKLPANERMDMEVSFLKQINTRLRELDE